MKYIIALLFLASCQRMEINPSTEMDLQTMSPICICGSGGIALFDSEGNKLYLDSTGEILTTENLTVFPEYLSK